MRNEEVEVENKENVKGREMRWKKRGEKKVRTKDLERRERGDTKHITKV